MCNTTTNNINNKNNININKNNNIRLIINKSIKDRLAGVPKHNLFLIVTTLILIFLFLSATILLYRIGKVQNKYTFALQVRVKSY